MSSGGRVVAILAFDDMEVLDYAGPYEVFNVAGELSGGSFQVTSVGVGAGDVVGRGGFTVVPEHTLDSCPPADIVVVPGGAGSRVVLRNETVLDWLRLRTARGELIASVCSGALVLGAAGLLENRSATTHHDALDELAAISPSTKVVANERFLRSAESVWTAGGVSAGIDLALHLVREIAGSDLHAAVHTEMEWGWPQARITS